MGTALMLATTSPKRMSSSMARSFLPILYLGLHPYVEQMEQTLGSTSCSPFRTPGRGWVETSVASVVSFPASLSSPLPYTSLPRPILAVLSSTFSHPMVPKNTTGFSVSSGPSLREVSQLPFSSLVDPGLLVPFKQFPLFSAFPSISSFSSCVTQSTACAKSARSTKITQTLNFCFVRRIGQCPFTEESSIFSSSYLVRLCPRGPHERAHAPPNWD